MPQFMKERRPLQIPDLATNQVRPGIRVIGCGSQNDQTILVLEPEDAIVFLNRIRAVVTENGTVGFCRLKVPSPDFTSRCRVEGSAVIRDGFSALATRSGVAGDETTGVPIP